MMAGSQGDYGMDSDGGVGTAGVMDGMGALDAPLPTFESAQAEGEAEAAADAEAAPKKKKKRKSDRPVLDQSRLMLPDAVPWVIANFGRIPFGYTGTEAPAGSSGIACKPVKGNEVHPPLPHARSPPPLPPLPSPPPFDGTDGAWGGSLRTCGC